MKRILLLAGLLLAACAPKSDMDKYIDGLMGRMTLEQKLGQLNLHSASGFVAGAKLNDEDANVQAVRDGKLGGIFGSSDVEFLRQMQQIALESGAGIPLITGMDVIHGFQTVFPIPLALSTSWNPDLIEKSARIAATEASAHGINWVFSPMVDICRDARWGRIAEGGGEDPFLGGELAKAYVRGYQGTDGVYDDHDVMVCVKHYALYGAAEAGRDYNSVFLSRQEALNGYMRPYQQAAYAGADSYMSSFNEFEGIPASMNNYLMNELLRDTWGFKGFIVSDYTAVSEQIAHGIGDLQEVSARSLKAGLDMDMNADGFVGTLAQSLKEGRVTQADIDRACRRILEAKYKLGLFEDPFKYLDPARAAKESYTPEHLAAAREAARECMVLLKNDGVLPLKKEARVAVVGPLAKNASAMAGCWSTGSHNSECVTLYDGIAEAARSASYAEGSWLFKDKELEETILFGMTKSFMPGFQAPSIHTVPQERLVAEAVAKARQADVVVACVGETDAFSGEASSRSDISIPDAQVELLKALKATGKPVVMVLVTGRPLTIEWENENMDEDQVLNTTEFSWKELQRLIELIPQTDPTTHAYGTLLESIERYGAIMKFVDWFLKPQPEVPVDNIIQFTPATSVKAELVEQIKEAPEAVPEYDPAAIRSLLSKARAAKKIPNLKEWINTNFGVDGFAAIPAKRYPEVMDKLKELGVC